MSPFVYLVVCFLCATLAALISISKIKTGDIPVSWGYRNTISRFIFIWIPLWYILLHDFVKPYYAKFNSPVEVTWRQAYENSDIFFFEMLIAWAFAPVVVVAAIGHWLLDKNRLINWMFGQDAEN